MFPDSPTHTSRDKPWTVGELTGLIQQVLEESFPSMWIVGEVSNFKLHSASGHAYLTLKDDKAQLPAVIWQSNMRRVKFEVKHGMQVVARGKISVYGPQGKYQFYIEELHPKGMGALELALQQLKEKLQKRGWFAEERKKPLPKYPRRIALVTSPTGAAVRDMLRIILERWPAVEVLVCPVAVQGANAAPDIAAAIRRLNELRHVEVMIVGRGGGSLEDLWAFNEEVVAEAIFQSLIPVVSAVGHEIDFTIADLVADLRAPTPTAAAALVVPDQRELCSALTESMRRLTYLLNERLRSAGDQVNQLAARRPFRQPLAHVHDLGQKLDDWADRLQRAARVLVDRRQEQMSAAAARLDGLSPLNVLGRGYSLTRKDGQAALLRNAGAVKVGERILTHLAQGQLASRVEEVVP